MDTSRRNKIMYIWSRVKKHIDSSGFVPLTHRETLLVNGPDLFLHKFLYYYNLSASNWDTNTGSSHSP